MNRKSFLTVLTMLAVSADIAPAQAESIIVYRTFGVFEGPSLRLMRIGQIEARQAVEVTHCSDDWCRVEVSDNLQGWAMSSIRQEQPPPTWSSSPPTPNLLPPTDLEAEMRLFRIFGPLPLPLGPYPPPTLLSK